MADVALGVRDRDGVGTTPLAMRRVIGGVFPRTGIVGGCRVAGGPALAYEVAAGVAVCSKGAGDGCTLAAVSAGSTPAVAANAAGHDRIDAVWVTSHDPDGGDADNLVTLGVTEGTASATPARPTAPTYATVLAYMRVPAGATTLSTATVEAVGDVASPAGGSLGQLGHAALNGSRDVGTGGHWTDYYACATSVTVPSRHLARADYHATLKTAAQSSTAWTGTIMYLTLDGSEVAGSRRICHLTQGVEQTFSASCGFEAPAGAHTVELRLAYFGGGWDLHIVDDGTGGAAVTVWDEGAA